MAAEQVVPVGELVDVHVASPQVAPGDAALAEAVPAVQHPAVVEDGHLSRLQPVLEPGGGGGLDAPMEVAVRLVVPGEG